MITVFYDGKCGLCSKEINYYRKIAPNNIFDWQDITESTEELKKANISLAEGLKLLHAKDHNGQMYIGIDAFIVIWEQLKGWSILAALIRLPIIRHIANGAYQIFASWRFKQLKHCQLATKHDTSSRY
ncbi:MAG: DUF393 domain-containing protein [Gammaproteobacteria bacterium]|nr:DUF393 domain-containing protein [Gammaproteobacteria bacterium]